MEWKNLGTLFVLCGVLVGCTHTKRPYVYYDKKAAVEFEGYDVAYRAEVSNQSYYFNFDSFAVDEQDFSSLKIQGNYLLKNSSARIRLEGNTDERGTREYNVALGWRRAKAVANCLLSLGVKKEQIAIVSFGKEKPISNGHDESAYAKNRRVDLVYEVK